MKCKEVKHMPCIPYDKRKEQYMIDIVEMMNKTAIYLYLSSVTFVEREKHSSSTQIVFVKTTLTVDNTFAFVQF